MPFQGKDGKKLELAQVIAPYEATSKEQLSLVQVTSKVKYFFFDATQSISFSKGTMIVIKKKTETGWWQGEQVGRSEAPKKSPFSCQSEPVSAPKKGKENNLLSLPEKVTSLGLA